MQIFENFAIFRHIAKLGVVKRRQFLGYGLAAIVLAGCASMGGLTAESPNQEKVAVVTERAAERWKALIAGDLPKAYEFISPATRSVMSLEQYKGRINPRMFRDVRIDKVTCEAEVCAVNLTLTYDHRLMKGVSTPLAESWVLDKGQFWYSYRE
jgi:hypothetical protein